MKSRDVREQELLSSGLFDSIKGLYKENSNIPDKYIMLIADYIESLGMLSESFNVNVLDIAKQLPSVLNGVYEKPLRGIHGVTDNKVITMNSNLGYETNKMYFFHELTHALQTRFVNDHEECGFYNGKTGMFLTEGATQYTAEILYNMSNDFNISYRMQSGVVRGQSTHTTYSPLDQYQYNGNILMLLSYTMDLPLPQVLSLFFRSNGREIFKNIYESMEGNNGRFESFMLDLEKIYSIDKLLLAGYSKELSGNPIRINLMNNAGNFMGNLDEENKLMNKVERDLLSMYFLNHDDRHILENYDKILPFLTTDELKQTFMSSVSMLNNNSTFGSRGGSVNYFYLILVSSIILIIIAIIIFIIK